PVVGDGVHRTGGYPSESFGGMRHVEVELDAEPLEQPTRRVPGIGVERIFDAEESGAHAVASRRSVQNWSRVSTATHRWVRARRRLTNDTPNVVLALACSRSMSARAALMPSRRSA